MSFSFSSLKNIRVRAFILILTIILLILIADRIGTFVGINTYLYDLSFKIRGYRPHNRDIILINIDEQTLNDLGRWPLNRKYYARLIEKLDKAEAVGLNLIFSEPSAEDSYLFSAIEKNAKVILPFYIDDRYNINGSSDLFKGKSGHIHVEMDHDGITRSIFHNLSFKTKQYFSFPFLIYKTATQKIYLNETAAFTDKPDDDSFIIRQNNPMLINYYGPPGVYERISLSEALTDAFPSEYFKNKIVIIGISAPGIENTILTPFARNYGVMTSSELYANILNNLLDKNWIVPVNEHVRTIAVVLFSFFSFILFLRSKPTLAFIFFSCSLAFLFLISFFLFKYGNEWLSPAVFIISLFFTFFLAYMKKLEYTGESLERAKLDWEDAFDTLTDSIIIQNNKGKIIRTNKSFIAVRSDFLIKRLGQNFITLLDGYQNSEQNMNDREPVAEKALIEKDLYWADADKHLEINSLPRWSENDKFRGVVHVVRDITEKVTTQEQRRNLENQLIQAQKMEAIGTLAGGIAHDFNNILSAIIGYTELALYEVSPGNHIKPYLYQTLGAGKRAGELVKQILAFSRKTDSEIKHVRVAPIVKETIKLLKSTLPATIDIRQHIEDTPMVMGDPTQIHQIVMNLCTNAYHAMQENGGLLTVSLQCKEFPTASDLPAADMQPGNFVELKVSDTGHGIPLENLGRIFDPYYTTKTRGKGTGLGLAVVHGIVKASHGAIIAESRPNAGTTFSVFLPAVHSEEQAVLDDEEALPGGNERILLVDDEPALIDVERQLLNRLGYSVTSRTSSTEALKLFSKGPGNYDLVITDMTMPELTGDNLVRELLKIRADIPIVLCTGFSERISEENANELGIREFVTKPILMRELAPAIRRALGAEKHITPTGSAEKK